MGAYGDNVKYLNEKIKLESIVLWIQVGFIKIMKCINN